MEKDSLVELLVEEFASMPPQLQAAARFVLDHPKDVALMSMREQARLVGVSHTTMARLSAWLGLEGYQDLRAIHIRALRASKNLQSDAGNSAGHSLCGNANITARKDATAPAPLAASLSESGISEQLSAMADLLSGSHRLFCLGLRSAQMVARHFANLLSRLGKHVAVIDMPIEAGIDYAGSGSAMLAISFAPHTRATIEIVQQASRRGIVIATITDSLEPPLVRVARESIIVPTKSYSFFQGIAPALSATEILAALIADRRGAEQQLKEKSDPTRSSGWIFS